MESIDRGVWRPALAFGVGVAAGAELAGVAVDPAAGVDALGAGVLPPGAKVGTEIVGWVGAGAAAPPVNKNTVPSTMLKATAAFNANEA
jgi:hypothetical protein